jgi:hypothetical protein
MSFEFATFEWSNYRMWARIRRSGIWGCWIIIFIRGACTRYSSKLRATSASGSLERFPR